MPTLDKIKTVVGKVTDFFSTVTPDKGTNDPDKYMYGSVSDYTKNLVMTFPVLCDDSISPETASMISKANERNISTMLRLLFTSMNIEAKDGMKALATVHKNIKVNSDVYDVLDKLENIKGNLENSSIIGFGRKSEAIDAINEEVRTKQKNYPVNSLNERSLNDYIIHNINGTMIIKEDNDTENTKYKKYAVNAKVQGNYNDYSTTSSTVTNIKNPSPEDLVSKLSDNDVKKANEMQPTILTVNYNYTTDKGVVETKTFLAGVKSRLIKVDSNDMIERIIAKNRTKISFLNFIRATTGEIKLIKDFLLAIDQAKLDSKNAVKKGPAAEMWNCLASRGAKNSKNRIKKSGNDASAITVLVISQETVDAKKKFYKFDLERVSNAKSIMQDYNLMGIIIADDSVEVVKTLYSGNDVFDQQAYSYIEKESDNSYKKVINLMNKMNTR